MQPSDRSLHDPARLTQTAAVLGSASGDLGTDALRQQGKSVRVGVVAPIGLEEFGFSLRVPGFARNGGDRPNQRQQLGNVVPIGLGQDDRERNTLRIRKEVVF